MIEFQHISKYYGANAALHDVSFYGERGTTTVLLGESGSGKSTVLRLIAGIVMPDKGVIMLDGQPMTQDILPKMRLQMGYVIQEGGLFPHLTAGDNVRLVARYVQGWSEQALQRRCEELLDLTHLDRDILHRYPLQLSGGQRQRVALMRALMLRPRILLLDEAFTALDPLVRRDIQRDVRRIIEELQITTLLVTHDIREAEYMCAGKNDNTIIVLQKGCVVQQGTMQSLRVSPANEFVREFVALDAAP